MRKNDERIKKSESPGMNENRAQGLLSRISKQKTDRRNSRRYFFVSRTAGQLHFVHHRVTRRLSSFK
jgi:hypothetical protein